MRSLSDSGRSLAVAFPLPPGNGNLAVALDSRNPPPVGVPDALAPFHLASPAERMRRVRDVLRIAWRIYRDGKRSMCDSIDDAAAGSATGPFAKISLRRILLELNLSAWESHPARTRADVHALFRRAIGRLTPHRGGWRISR
jgi:hypothetical protein